MRLPYLLLALLLSSYALAQNQPLKSPSVSGNALFLYRNSNLPEDTNAAGDSVRNGINVQEAEFAFFSDVDPYSRLTMLFSVSPKYTQNATSGKYEESWSVEPEELFVESDHVPGVTLKAGKFKAAFGKHNVLHTHAFPFVDAPLINRELLGDEGLNDVGVSAAYLLPSPWFSELTAQALRGEGENDEFNSRTAGDVIGVGRWKNLWDLCADMTLEFGTSYARGSNALEGATTLMGGDLTLKWRPAVGGKYRSGILGAEFIDRMVQRKTGTDGHGQGVSVWTAYQFSQRWLAKLRYETLQTNDSPEAVSTTSDLVNGLTTKVSTQLQFDATEFSFFRLEYSTAHSPVRANGLDTEHKIYLQAGFTIGAHPAHQY